jgi:DNA-directed RNA polymerase subunit M/transcription elongation factor TFIIS
MFIAEYKCRKKQRDEFKNLLSLITTNSTLSNDWNIDEVLDKKTNYLEYYIFRQLPNNFANYISDYRQLCSCVNSVLFTPINIKLDETDDYLKKLKKHSFAPTLAHQIVYTDILANLDILELISENAEILHNNPRIAMKYKLLLYFPAELTNIALEIEREYYNNLVKKYVVESPTWENENFCMDYFYKIGQLISIITSDHAENFFNCISSGLLTPQVICASNIDKLCPTVFEEYHVIINNRKNQKIIKKTSKLYTCSRCGASECTYSEHQRRASDECGTIECECSNCGFTWKG